MQLDWITVSAQIVNFLVLIWLLKRFLYGPVVAAMDRREQRIAERLGEADQRERRAEDEAERHREALEALEAQRNEIVTLAQTEAEEERMRLLDEARAEINDLRTSWQRQVEAERQEFLAGLGRETARAVVAVARRVLGELAGTDLEARVVDVFVERLAGLDAAVREQLAASPSVRVTSAFELDGAARERLTQAVHEHLAPSAEVEFARAPELVCGIELTSGGRRLAFSFEDFVDDLGARFESALSPSGAEAPEGL